jgi:four helix bundle protein
LSTKTFRTLDLAVEFYKATQALEIPKHLKDQLARAASSVPMNLAEGNAKFSYRDKSRIYQIAYGSLRECQVILRLAEVSDAEVDSLSNRLGAAIYKLLQGVQSKIAENQNTV